MASPSSSSPEPVVYSIAVGTGWRPLGASGTITRSAPGQVQEIDGRPALEFLARYLDVTGPASFGNPSRRDGGRSRRVLPARGHRVGSGVRCLVAVRLNSRRLDRPADDRDDRGDSGRDDPRSLAAATSAFPAGSRPEAALMFSCAVRRLLLGSRAERGGGARPDRARHRRPPGRAVLLRRDRSDRGRRGEPLPERHVRDPPARIVTDARARVRGHRPGRGPGRLRVAPQGLRPAGPSGRPARGDAPRGRAGPGHERPPPRPDHGRARGRAGPLPRTSC